MRPGHGLLRNSILGTAPAGPNLLVVHTVVGGASQTALVIDQHGWPEVVGTVAGDDTIFLATSGAREQNRLLERLNTYLKEE